MPFTLHFILIKPVLNDHLSYVTIFQCSHGRSYKTGDKHGNYTCINASVVDYCICNARFVNIFVTLKVLEFSKLFSDVHCPLSICLNVKRNCLANTTESSQKATEKVKRWDNEKLLSFQSSINQDDLNKTIVQLVRA